MINLREGWRGHLWQGRFASFIMDEKHLLACTKYIELNPVRAELIKNPYDWKWSSAREHLEGNDDILVKIKPLLTIIQKSWKSYLNNDVKDDEIELFRKHERTGRPIGNSSFIDTLEQLLDRNLKPQKTGPKVVDK